MWLFPAGELDSGKNYGLIDNIQYNYFEPNRNFNSFPTYSSLQTRFQNQTILSRKIGEPFLNIIYEYSNIFASEYRQIEHFINKKEDAVNSFYVIDLSKGEVPSAIDTSSTWIPSISNTRLYSAVSNMKANYIFFFNGIKWKLGTITTVTTNTSVTTDVDTNNFGTLSDTEGAVVTGNQCTFIYPVYQCYVLPNQMANFKRTNYWDNKDSENYGPMYSGSISFVSKYKV